MSRLLPAPRRDSAVRTLLLAVAVAAPLAVLQRAPGSKFFGDDPHWVEADTQDASGVKAREIDLTIDLATHAVSALGESDSASTALQAPSIDGRQHTCGPRCGPRAASQRGRRRRTCISTGRAAAGR